MTCDSFTSRGWMQAKINLLHMALLVQTQQAQAPLGKIKL